MINVDDVKELEQAPSTLPPLYSAWMVHALQGPLPQETKATCANCVMCQPAYTAAESGASYFHPETKCCTWMPELPNFLVGRILTDDSPNLREGRISVEERIRKGVAVTPLGLGQDAMYRQLYNEAIYNQANGTFSGRSRALRCPHYIEEGGRCGVWKHRNARCATWFCKHERGAAGYRFWMAIKQLLDAVEEGLATWCVSQLDVETEALKFLLSSAQQATADPRLYQAIWGKWTGQEKDFFRACAELVNPLSWEEVYRICGSKLAIFARFAQEAYTALQSKTLPPLLQARPYRTIREEPGYSEVISYSDYDPLRLSNVLRDVLPHFDGRPLEAVQQTIRREKKIVLNESLIRKLIDHDLLGSVTDIQGEYGSCEELKTTKINIGLVGLGEIAQIIHLPILQAHSDKFKIAAICDISQELLSALGERYNVPAEHHYLDYKDLAKQEDLDAIFVLNCDEYHTDAALAAIEHGKHVLIEKPMCLTRQEAVAIIKARDKAGVQVMVAYMRRYAPAFVQAVEHVRALEKINYARVRDIIGHNAQFVEQSSVVLRRKDIPPEAMQDRAARASRLVKAAIGEAPPQLVGTYRLLCGLGCHDLSAMREMLGMPRSVIAARRHGNGFLTALFKYDGFTVTFETGIDHNCRFDAHIAVYGETKEIRIQYNTPYIRHLPTELFIKETRGEAFEERVIRPSFTDAFTMELLHFYEVVTQNTQPKTTAEDFLHDLDLFEMLINALRE